MAGIGRNDGQPSTDLAVSVPRQRRTREQWERVLNAGVDLLEVGGYEAFTIAALCERAEVPPRALYARATTKDALFLAVYEWGMRSVLADHAVFTDQDLWSMEDDRSRVEQAVRCLVTIFVAHAAFLRAVVLISGAHAEILRRGEAYRRGLCDLFVAVLRQIGGPTREAEFCFAILFAVLVMRLAYGEDFGPRGDPELLAGELVTMAQRYLLPNR